jgi:hypothetical protein
MRLLELLVVAVVGVVGQLLGRATVQCTGDARTTARVVKQAVHVRAPAAGRRPSCGLLQSRGGRKVARAEVLVIRCRIGVRRWRGFSSVLQRR